MTVASALTLNSPPSAGFDEPFGMLVACHERVQRMLALLSRLADHLPAQGPDGPARQAAADVMRYFDRAAPAHHEDEERHVFPRLRAAGGAAAALADELHEEHTRMAAAWQALRADLLGVAAGALPADGTGGWRARWQAFDRLYRGHIEREEAAAYPAARALLPAAELAAMGAEMARRRGVR
ncbi:MAG: hemerythrin domain-containing protein [Rubrivivax sp.]|nr:hemerythrin domain-containing protein [Rubrivivax sp.]